MIVSVGWLVSVSLLVCSGVRGGTDFGGPARIETENFVIKAYDAALAGRVGREVEALRGDIARRLGISRLPSWRPKCELCICDNRTCYLRQSKAAAWSSGWSTVKVAEAAGEGGGRPVQRCVYTYEKDSYDELLSVITHELAHVVIRDAVGVGNDIPLWLDEGAANYIQGDGMEDYQKVVTRGLARESALPLRILFSEKGYPEEKTLFYAQSASVVDMMMRTYGSVSFLVFARALVGGKPVARSLNDCLSAFSGDIDAFDEEWREYAINNY